MNLTELTEFFGEKSLLTTGGLSIGFLFGFFAQRSKFCLRSAVIEFSHGKFGERLLVWLLTFSTAVIAVQTLSSYGVLDVSSSRQLTNRGSLSGAMVGGLCFGIGMILARGCASRLLVLSANGNLRALLSGLIFAVTAQSALSGALAPIRLFISNWWTIEGGASRDLLSTLGWGHTDGIWFGLSWLFAIFYFAKNVQYRMWMWAGALGTGLCVTLAWWWSYLIASVSFETVPIQGITFSGPSAEWLMRVLAPNSPEIGFDFGLLPGVFAGSLISALLTKEFKLEGFSDGYSMRRYIFGSVLMGFGAMLAGGCAVGSGVTGTSIFSITAWLALSGMWLGAAVTDRLFDVAPSSAPALAQP
jgi:uncharacterized membrane protein YedE/YeeE